MNKAKETVCSTILIMVLFLVSIEGLSAKVDKPISREMLTQRNSGFNWKTSSSEQRRAPKAVNESKFKLFYANVKSMSFSKEKLKMLETGAIGNKFTCDQAAKLINLLSFTKEKIEAIEILAGAIIDRENYKKIEECLTFQSEKEQVRDILISTESSSHSSQNRYGRAMNEDDFNLFYANVKSMSFSKEKFKMLHAGIMDCNITCSQAARLINLFSFTKEKIEAIEMLARSIVDKENYRKIEECFTFQSEKEQVRDILIITKSPDRSSATRDDRAMNEKNFNLLYTNVKSVSYSKERLKMLQTGAISNKFTCNQAVRLVKIFSLSSDKLEAIEILAGHLVDKENYRKIEECFMLESDKRKVRAALGL